MYPIGTTLPCSVDGARVFCRGKHWRIIFCWLVRPLCVPCASSHTTVAADASNARHRPPPQAEPKRRSSERRPNAPPPAPPTPAPPKIKECAIVQRISHAAHAHVVCAEVTHSLQDRTEASCHVSMHASALHENTPAPPVATLPKPPTFCALPARTDSGAQSASKLAASRHDRWSMQQLSSKAAPARTPGAADARATYVCSRWTQRISSVRQTSPQRRCR